MGLIKAIQKLRDSRQNDKTISAYRAALRAADDLSLTAFVFDTETGSPTTECRTLDAKDAMAVFMIFLVRDEQLGSHCFPAVKESWFDNPAQTWAYTRAPKFGLAFTIGKDAPEKKMINFKAMAAILLEPMSAHRMLVFEMDKLVQLAWKAEKQGLISKIEAQFGDFWSLFDGMHPGENFSRGALF